MKVHEVGFFIEIQKSGQLIQNFPDNWKRWWDKDDTVSL